MGGNPIAFDWFGVWVSFTMLIYIGLIVLAIYLMVAQLSFLNTRHRMIRKYYKN